MKTILVTIFAVAITAFQCWCAQPQTGPDFRAIPGKILNHNGIIINPAPIEIKYTGKGDIDLSIDIPTIVIESGEYLAEKGIVKPVSGAYRIILDSKKISIFGYDQAAIFYAQQTLRQIRESAQRNQIAKIGSLEIEDYPSLSYRGVVEGFYGTPWSHEARLSVIDFMGRNKMNSYVYGPKDDPYHRTPDWRKPYPEKEGRKIAELAQRCKENYINFVWAIHPGGDIKWDEEDYNHLLNKFEAMYKLGVKGFAIFFDDIKGDGTDSHKQAALLNRIVKDFVSKKDDVENLIVCPTDYNQGWANPAEDGQLAIYGRELDPSVEVFWTGKTVCGDIEKAAMDFVDSRINRPALVWWNFPVTDYCRKNLLLGPVYGLDTSLDSSSLCGIETNPMEHAEASKSAIYGVADYGWNPQGYNALDNWTRSFAEVMPGAPEAYGTFAIHSADPPKNYRRNESWNIETFRINEYTAEKLDNLEKEFKKIVETPDKIVKDGGNPALVKEIAPWLVEFENLGNRGLMATKLVRLYETKSEKEFKELYEKLEMLNSIQKPGYLEHRSGTLKLQPFIDNLIEDLKPYYESL